MPAIDRFIIFEIILICFLVLALPLGYGEVFSGSGETRIQPAPSVIRVVGVEAII
jgi:hypothetical protein